MSDSEEVNKLVTNITGVVEAEICEKIPEIIEQKSQQIFDQVIAILSTKREQIREIMISEFKKSINNEIMNDQSIKDMLVSILKEGTQKVFDVKSLNLSANNEIKKGGKQTKKNRLISRNNLIKSKRVTKKYNIIII